MSRTRLAVLLPVLLLGAACAQRLLYVDDLEALARGGDVGAQFQVGVIRADEQDGAANPREAARWFRMAAGQGHPGAQCALFLLHESGEVPARDEAEALGWLRSAAEGGQPLAMFHLGMRFMQGEGVPRDEAAGARWLRRGAELGDARSQLALGVMLVVARGVAPDRIEALQWITLAEEGLEDEEDRKIAAARRAVLRREMSAADIAQAERRVAARR